MHKIFSFSTKLKLILGLLIAIFIAIIGIITVKSHLPLAIAHVGGNDWTSGKDLDWTPDNWVTWFTQGGSYYFSDTTSIRWNTSSANALKNSGHRYTQDNNDEPDSGTTAHFDATGNWGTNFPNPDFDVDNNVWGDCVTYDEAEVTADNASFPTPDTSYWTSFQWIRGCTGTGNMFYTAQLSDWLIEWQTRHYDLLYTHAYSSSGAMKIFETLFAFMQKVNQFALAHEEVMSVNNSEIDKGSYSYFIKKLPQSKEIDVDVKQKITSKEDLDAYKNLSIIALERLKKDNVSETAVVVTFAFPQEPGNFVKFVKKNNLNTLSFEMTATDARGDLITLGGSAVGGLNPKAVFDEMRLSPTLQKVEKLQLNGVVSLEGKIDLVDYENLANQPNIYFVDILPEMVARELKISNVIAEDEIIDVNANDLYWYKEIYK